MRGKRHPGFPCTFHDALNQCIFDVNSNPAPTPHGVYVDDDIYLNVADIHWFEQAIATSIEAIFILLGESNTALHQDPISWDKLHELLVAPVNRILGLVLNLRHMTIGTPPEFISAIINICRTTWGPHRLSFKVKEAEELMGKLNHIAFSPPGMKYLLRNIYASLADNSHLVFTSQWFRDALLKINAAPASAEGDAKQAFHNGANARLFHGCTALHHICSGLRRDLFPSSKDSLL
jgi:hypothetical protein